VMIGGFINGGGNGGTEVLVRALGPTLRSFGITDPLADPTIKRRVLRRISAIDTRT